MSKFDIAIQTILSNEGIVENNASDKGGLTKYGISYHLYKSIYPNAIEEDILTLTKEKAIEIYQKNFWNPLLDSINAQIIVTAVFDAGINCGMSNSIKMLQRAIMACMANSEVILDDGVLGDKTIYFVNSVPSHVLLTAYRSEHAGYYREIIAKNPLQGLFLKGWLKRAYSA